MKALARCIRSTLAAALSLAALPALAAKPEDAWITTKVKVALLTDDRIDGLGIDVDTMDGRVTLHGQVASPADKGEAGIKILSSKLTVIAHGLKGLDAAQFAEVAREAEGRCPVSNAYRGTLEITVDAKVA